MKSNKFSIIKSKYKQLKKKGMNTIETSIIIVIILLCIMTFLDLMEITQKFSAASTTANYVTRLVGRQGGISNNIPKNFTSYGHGPYITSSSACGVLNQSLQKAYGKKNGGNVLGNDVKVYLTSVKRGQAPETTELNESTNFGIYIKGANSGTGANTLISDKDVLYHQAYYVVTVKANYDMFTIQKLLTFSDSAFTSSEENKTYTKTFTRIIVPAYYERNSDKYINNSSEWFVK